jgi:hypothetical protein
VLVLGHRLTAELGFADSCDTLGKWMAHHVAELIENAETSTDIVLKQEYIDKAVKTILKLWQHRHTLPDGCRPFENFEPIFRAIKNLDPENSHSSYLPKVHVYPRNYGVQDDDKNLEELGGVQKWINIAEKIDRSARVLIDFSLRQAVQNAEDEKTKEYIKKASNLADNSDIQILLKFIDPTKKESEEEDLEQMEKAEKEIIEAKLAKVEELIKQCETIREKLISG